ncbi:MAG: hypothetical protein ABIS03_08040, partial [Gemmatimonadaceae bacterium]
SWVTEGLAVYYESRVTGSGRLEGSEHSMLARAAAEVNRVPRIGELSRSTTRFPGGESVYAYGGLIFDYLSRTRGPEKIGSFIDRTSRVILPLSLNARAKGVFGISFENAWNDWQRDLVARTSHREPLAGWRDLTTSGRSVDFPRWSDDSTIIFGASTGREVTGEYAVGLDGGITRIARRNVRDSNVPLPGGGIVFAQPDFVDAFHYRSDLWISKNGHESRLTRGARLAQPDVNRDGKIVAVQSVPGSSRLVVVTADGATISPIAEGDAAVQWAEPRWSPDGELIAAVRVDRGTSSVMLMNPVGSNQRVLIAQRAVVATPSWSPDGKEILFSSDVSGVTQAYSMPVSGEGQSLKQLTNASTGFFYPVLSPDGRLLAGTTLRYDGYHLGVGPLASVEGVPSTIRKSPREGCLNCILASDVTTSLTETNLPKPRRYSPWRTLAPQYWEPLVSQASGSGTAIGAATSGSDVIGRHSFNTQALYNSGERETEAFAAYRYDGLGQPALTFSADQEYDHFSLSNSSGRVGALNRRTRTAGVGMSFARPRVRTFSSLALGAEVESRRYTTDPDTLLARLPGSYGQTNSYPSLFASATWSNTRRPQLAISREDGVSLSTVVRQRWQSGDFSGSSRSVIGVTALYKSLALPGFAHHVIAFRAAGGYADDRAISTFSAGGLSGGSLDFGAVLAVGGERRTFGVRGFSPSTEQGIRALSGTAEYRAPIAAPSRRLPFIPVLFDRISVSAFADAGRAFCPSSAGVTDACRPGRGPSPWLASTGAELDFDTALQYDVPARFRAGVAVPVASRRAVGADPLSFYLTFGAAF